MLLTNLMGHLSFVQLPVEQVNALLYLSNLRPKYSIKI
jgi:hypothetical protein